MTTKHLIQLLALPAETRLIVFEYAVTEDETLMAHCLLPRGTIICYDYEDEDEVFQTAQTPALTRTCRAIRYDTIPMFYKFNDFEATYSVKESLEVAWEWLREMGPMNRAMMKSFQIRRMYCTGGAGLSIKNLRTLLQSPIVREGGGMFVPFHCGSRGCNVHSMTFPLEEDDPMDRLARLFGETELE